MLIILFYETVLLSAKFPRKVRFFRRECLAKFAKSLIECSSSVRVIVHWGVRKLNTKESLQDRTGASH